MKKHLLVWALLLAPILFITCRKPNPAPSESNYSKEAIQESDDFENDLDFDRVNEGESEENEELLLEEDFSQEEDIDTQSLEEEEFLKNEDDQ